MISPYLRSSILTQFLKPLSLQKQT